MKLPWIIDADSHVTEPSDVWTSRVPRKYIADVPHVVRRDDGVDIWLLGDEFMGTATGNAIAGWPGFPTSHPPTFSDCHPASYDAEARVAYLDEAGIWAQVLYPNVAGFGSQRFLKLKSDPLKLACVKAYNDFLQDWCSVAPDRLIGVMSTPFWDVKATVAEIERGADLGYRGILFTGEPHRFGLPLLGDRYWDPLWSVAQETGLPIHFHIGGGETDRVGGGYEDRLEALGPIAAETYSAPALFMKNGLQCLDLISSGVLQRYPEVKFVSVESGIGWIPFMLEAADYTYLGKTSANRVRSDDLLPSDLFARQVYATVWFEQVAVTHLLDLIPVDNVLFETDFPHVACLYGNIRETIDAGLGSASDEVRQKILWENFRPAVPHQYCSLSELACTPKLPKDPDRFLCPEAAAAKGSVTRSTRQEELMSSTEEMTSHPVEKMPVLPAPWAQHIRRTQEAAKRGEFHVAQVPGYEQGVPAQPSTWHHMDMLELYPKVYGRECGANGIGRLREAALVEITKDEKFGLFDEDPMYFPQTGLAYGELDISQMQDQSAEYQAALEDAGVIVHRFAFPSPPVGAFGPMRGTWAANELLVLRGGSVIEKIAINPFGNGRCEYLAYWAWTQLGVPPLLTIAGEGVAEAGPCFWLAEDVFVCAHGLAFNEDGLNQLLPAIARSSRMGLDDLNVLKIECAGGRYFYPKAGTSHHPDMVLGPLDVDKVIAYPPGLDFTTWSWLKEHDYKIVEVDRDEQLLYAPANVTIIEPGRVIMAEGATDAIAQVRKLDVDVVTVPYDQFLRSGGGLHCSTLRVWRDQGPYSTDR